MDHHTSRREAKHEEFSLPLFAFTVIASLGGLFGLLWWLAPSVWDAQMAAPLWKLGVAFLAVHLLNAFVEFIFHRYVLHMPAIPILARLYRQHTLHHALTRIGRRQTKDGRGILVVENKYPIVEEEQGEASFFPWYSMAIFALVLSPLLVALHWLVPGYPWFFGGFAALALSLTLYEVLHAIEHWPFEKWEPLITHRTWGRFWMPTYAFHLRHHAVIDCNESISGFFAIPLTDWVFGTCVIPKTVYAEGEEWAPEKFQSPRPRWIIRVLDRWADRVWRDRRARAQGLEPRAYSRGEVIANWVTHGVGLATSIAGLVLLLIFSILRGDAWHVASFALFGLTLVSLSVAYAVYHAQHRERVGLFFRKLGYPAIFLLVAGTCAPFLISNLRGTVPYGGFWLLGAGVVCYCCGLVFYRWRQLRYHHTVWHTLSLGGGTCHLLAVLLFLLPHAG